MADEPERERIEAAATKPKKFTSDGVTVEAHPIADQIEAAGRAAANRNSKKRNRGLLFTRLRPGGTT